jgi:hypothetical protein
LQGWRPAQVLHVTCSNTGCTPSRASLGITTAAYLPPAVVELPSTGAPLPIVRHRTPLMFLCVLTTSCTSATRDVGALARGPERPRGRSVTSACWFAGAPSNQRTSSYATHVPLCSDDVVHQCNQRRGRSGKGARASTRAKRHERVLVCRRSFESATALGHSIIVPARKPRSFRLGRVSPHCVGFERRFRCDDSHTTWHGSGLALLCLSKLG